MSIEVKNTAKNRLRAKEILKFRLRKYNNKDMIIATI